MTHYTLTHLFLHPCYCWLILRGDNPCQLFIPTGSFRYVTFISTLRYEHAVRPHTTTIHGHNKSSTVSCACVRITIYQSTLQKQGVHLTPQSLGSGCSITHRIAAFGTVLVSLRYTLDYYLWQRTWLVWLWCFVSATWAFSGTGEVVWLSNHVRQQTNLVGGPRECCGRGYKRNVNGTVYVHFFRYFWVGSGLKIPAHSAMQPFYCVNTFISR